MSSCWRAMIALSSEQIRSLFAIAMLLGIVALSAESWALTWLAHHAVEEGSGTGPWFTLILKRLRYVAMLQGFFALILGLVVFGAEYFRLKMGDREIDAGRGGAR